MQTKTKLIYLCINLILVGALIYTSYSIEPGMYRNTIRLIFILAIPIVSLCQVYSTKKAERQKNNC
ncbi:hypothetical protein [Terrisporobacter muris]|jgi:hypothetical protein|uniref:Uncharacterized protein n=1 Tax=Terrisporobacter muris TaxID=2963284 RepID=A0A9X2MA82_9FIRM|nr:hypothetical protein [Terrisporobacter muris]MCR1822443.1 hypothetical protein [Terrisporobacter muris]